MLKRAMAPKNPWKTLSSEPKYTNPWIDVTEAKVMNAAGSPGIYGTVHFKNFAVGVLALDGERNTWLVGQWRYPLNTYSWEIPEGGGALDVDPLETAQRELREETGLSAGRWEKLFEMHLSNSVTDEKAIVYIATDLTAGDAAPEEDEVLALRKIPFDDAYAMAVRGEITDAISVAALFRMRILFSEGWK